MATNYPTGLDSYSAHADGVGEVISAATINALQDAVAALQVKAGITGSAVAGSTDKRVATLESAGGGINTPNPVHAGLLAWNFDPAPVAMSSTTGILTSGQMNTYAITLSAGTITNLLHASAGGGTVTNFFMALYNSAGNLLSTTNQQATAYNAGGLVTGVLAASQIVTAGKYYIGMWFSGGANAQQFRVTNSAPLANFALASPNMRYAQTNQTGLTTTAPSTVGTMTAQTQIVWVGAS